MDTHPYHNYFFFNLSSGFYQLAPTSQREAKADLYDCIQEHPQLIITPYLTRGFKPDTVFMLWCRGQDPAHVQELLAQIARSRLGRWLTLTHTYFGIVRPSQYSGRTGRPEQIIQNYDERLPYFIVYPFTKTHAWHQLELPDRKTIMYEHMNIGLTFPDIRQCLLYSYGVDDNEFVVSYETTSLEQFQDLVIKLRATTGRPYTLNDTPIFTCIYYPLNQFIELI